MSKTQETLRDKNSLACVYRTGSKYMFADCDVGAVDCSMLVRLPHDIAMALAHSNTVRY